MWPKHDEVLLLKRSSSARTAPGAWARPVPKSSFCFHHGFTICFTAVTLKTRRCFHGRKCFKWPEVWGPVEQSTSVRAVKPPWHEKLGEIGRKSTKLDVEKIWNNLWKSDEITSFYALRKPCDSDNCFCREETSLEIIEPQLLDAKTLLVRTFNELFILNAMISDLGDETCSKSYKIMSYQVIPRLKMF